MRKWLLFSIFSLVSFLTYAEPLPAAEVFQVEAKRIDPNTFVLHWQVKPGYFLYSERIKLVEAKNSNIHLGNTRFPQPLQKTDQLGRQYTVYRDQLIVPVAILGEHPGESLIKLQFQGCADDGFCYPPETRHIKLTIDQNLALNQVNIEKKAESIQAADTGADTGNAVENLFSNKHWFIVLLSFSGFGLLLSFTPCVLPMVPVLSGIIVGHGKALSTRKAFFLSLSYVLSMSLTYALVGAVVASLGSNLQIAMQAPWIISLFSLVFVLLALSMFGFYELRLPVSWQAKLAGLSRNQGNGHYLGSAVMGALSTLILSPCVTAPLIGVLGYIAHSGNILFGSFTLFFLGLGMGLPLLLIGTSAGKWLPKAGQWMNRVKAFFGIMLLAVAIYLLARILPDSIVMMLWASLLVFSGIYCGALSHAPSNQDKFRQGLGLMMLIYGLLVLIGASMGGSNPLQPLAGFQALASTASSPAISSQKIKTVNELNQALANAKGKPVLLDFYADWCTSCQIMEKTTFRDPQVEAVLKDFVILKVDVTDNNSQDKALLKQFKVVAPPTFLFFNKQGKEQENLRLVGETPTSVFLKKLVNAKDS